MGESASSSSAWWKRGGIHSTVTPQGTRKVELAVILGFFFGGGIIYIYIYIIIVLVQSCSLRFN